MNCTCKPPGVVGTGRTNHEVGCPWRKTCTCTPEDIAKGLRPEENTCPEHGNKAECQACKYQDGRPHSGAAHGESHKTHFATLVARLKCIYDDGHYGAPEYGEIAALIESEVEAFAEKVKAKINRSEVLTIEKDQLDGAVDQALAERKK